MRQTITIGDKSLTLDNNLGWALAYRDQFGRDVIPAIMPLVAGALDIAGGLLEETGKTKDVTIKDVLGILDGDRFMDAIVHLGSVEITDFINIVWALAKCADDDIPEPRTWIRQFDTFPMDVVAPAVFSLIAKGMISGKNLERLQAIKGSLQPNK